MNFDSALFGFGFFSSFCYICCCALIKNFGSLNTYSSILSPMEVNDVYSWFHVCTHTHSLHTVHTTHICENEMMCDINLDVWMLTLVPAGHTHKLPYIHILNCSLSFCQYACLYIFICCVFCCVFLFCVEVILIRCCFNFDCVCFYSLVFLLLLFCVFLF